MAVQYRALIIEDDPLVASDLETILQDAGFAICGIASTEDEAVELALLHLPDLITADVKLLSGTGISAIKRIAEKHNACVVYITGDRKDLEAQVGNSVCVDKPFDATNLVRVIEQAFASWLPPDNSASNPFGPRTS